MIDDPKSAFEELTTDEVTIVGLVRLEVSVEWLDQLFTRPDKRTERVGMLELVPERFLYGTMTVSRDQHVQLARCERDGFQHADVRFNLLVEEGALAGAGLHREGKRCQCARTGVDLGAVEVLGEDQAGNVGRGVALLFVDAVEEVERVGQHVARAACGVDDLQFLGAGDFEVVGLFVDRGDVVLHLLGQPGARPVEQPEASEGVLNEVANDPVRGEELRGGGDFGGTGLLALLEPREDVGLPLGDVELVQPADHLNVLADLLGQHGHRAGQHGAVGEKIRGNEELRVVAFALEHERHRAVPVAAVLREQQCVRLALRVVAAPVAVEQARHRLHDALVGDDRAVDVPALGLGEDFWLPALAASFR